MQRRHYLDGEMLLWVLAQDWDLPWTEVGWTVKTVWTSESLRLRMRHRVNRWRLPTGSWG